MLNLISHPVTKTVADQVLQCRNDAKIESRKSGIKGVMAAIVGDVRDAFKALSVSFSSKIDF